MKVGDLVRWGAASPDVFPAFIGEVQSIAGDRIAVQWLATDHVYPPWRDCYFARELRLVEQKYLEEIAMRALANL